jgi:pimeloyl-ACP methyl ester carboxylesterase
MTPFEQAPMQEVRLPQGTIRYRDVGSGEPIVLVHGLLVNGLLWRKVADELQKDFRCIVPDWPMGSHSVAMKPDADLSAPGQARIVADFLDALELDAVTLVGNDSGGAISQIVATQRPERIGRLALLSCDAFEIFPPRLFAYLSVSVRIPGAFYLLMQCLRMRIVQRAPISYGWTTKRPLEPAVLDAYVGPILRDRGVRRDTAKFIRGVSPRHTLDAATSFPRFRAPVLVAWGAEDRFFPWSLAERLAAAFPNSRLERIPDSRTFVSEDQPQRTAELIAGFVREAQAEPEATATHTR